MGSPPTAPARLDGMAADHHALAAHEVVLLLETDLGRGLDPDEADRRLGRYGPNELPEAAGAGPFVRFLRQFNHPLIYVLLVAGVVTLVLGEHVDSGVIFAVVLVNAVVGFIQESKAEAALDALRSMVLTESRVRRNGLQQTMPSAQLVPGDVVFVEAGDKVPADLRLVEVNELQVDESAMTGESLPVIKDEVVLDGSTPVADRRNMAYSGALVTAGSGVGVVVATGTSTELGEIHRLVGTADDLATPLTKKLTWFSKILTVAILGLATVTFGVGLARGESGTEMFTAAVALAVGSIPEGLPAVVTITLAIGVNRMARRRAVIRRMPAVETLGSTTVVCSDKTGTLTENQMTVRTIWTVDGRYRLTGSGYQPEGGLFVDAGDPGADAAERVPDRADLENDLALRWSLVAGAACNDARLVHEDETWSVIGDPTEAAMLVAAAKAGIDRKELSRTFERLGTVPFSSERRYMATLHRDRAGSLVVVVKGAVERVLELCGDAMTAGGEPGVLDGDTVSGVADELAADGLRVLATARAVVADEDAFDVDGLRGAMTFVGLQAMLDPPRRAAIDAVATCHRAGIAVKMITGDHATTATAIAEHLGILGERLAGDVLTGAQLAQLPSEAYPEAVEHASVFARVSPEQKLRLVEGLQARGHVVAMTGDGVNDAPALQQADIGVAMGRGGTEVAKEASDMVLIDDDFATIEAAIEEGRGVFDNLKKYIVWTVPTNMGEGLVILSAIVVGAALPILPVQILWINMTTALALGLMLSFEPKERGIMQRPPRDPSEPLFNRALVTRVLIVAGLLVGGAWWIFEWELANGAELPEARTAAINLFIAVKIAYLLSCRSLTQSVRQIGFFSNRWILWGIAAQLLGQLMITYVPVMNTVFGTAPISLRAWLLIILAGAVAQVVVTTHKRLGRARAEHRRQLATVAS